MLKIMFGMCFCPKIINQNNIFLVVTSVYFFFCNKVEPVYLGNILCMQVAERKDASLKFSHIYYTI